VRVPYFDLTAQYAELRDEILGAVDHVCRQAAFILGEEVARFEEAFAAYCEARHCIAVNSGTSALHLALLVAGVQPGDEVITTANTFFSTAETITYTGARPVFVDIDPRTANIDPGRIAAAITPRTRAIVPVHLYGRPADWAPIREIAERRHIPLIEDACQAHGARYRGQRVGSLGQVAVFSFYPTKNLGAYGEGGALTTNDDRIAECARALRHHGEVTRYLHDQVGYNYRMEGLQGAVLRVKLAHLPAWTARRQEHARRYRQMLAAARADIPEDDPRNESVDHLAVVYVDERDRVRAALEERGVGTAVHYPTPVHLQRAYAGLGYAPGSLPHTERACERVLSLPLFPELTAAQVEYAARTLAEIVGAR
jgi:dTDP-4-amino-4,6-dideoxygalactose transaminase